MRDAPGEPADRFHLLRLAELLFAIVESPARLPVSQRIADRPLEMCAHEMFFDVVGRALAQRRFIERAAAVAGQQDEGFVGPEILGQPDQVDACSIGKPLVDQVDVVFVRFDPFEAGGSGRDDLDLPLEVRVHERHLDKRLRLRIVIDQENADVAQVVRACRSSHARGGLGFFELLQNQPFHVGHPRMTHFGCIN